MPLNINLLHKQECLRINTKQIEIKIFLFTLKFISCILSHKESRTLDRIFYLFCLLFIYKFFIYILKINSLMVNVGMLKLGIEFNFHIYIYLFPIRNGHN